MTARWHSRRLTGPSPLRGSNGVALGPDGRLHVAQFLAGRISAVDLATGDVEVVVPPGGPIQSPDDLAFAPDGSMVVTDLVPGKVWRRAPDGQYELLSAEVVLPNGIAFAGNRLYVNEMRPNGRLLELTAGGPVELIGDLAMGNAMQLGPDGLLYYPHMITGRVYRVGVNGGEPELVADNVFEPVAVRFDLGGALLVLSRAATGVVTRIDLFGTGDRSTITSGVVGLDNAAFDAENRMFVSSYASGGVLELHPDGRTREVVRRGLDGPFGVTVDLGGVVRAADHYGTATLGPDGVDRELHTFTHGIAAHEGLLHLTSQYGQVRTHDPETGETRDRARGVDRPLGVAVRADGSLVVAESGAGRVLLISPEDEVTVLADGLTRPVDVALDDEGRCHVSDPGQGAVLRLDGATPTPLLAGLVEPQGITVLGGELFVVEVGTRSLRSIPLDGGDPRVELADLPVGGPDRPTPALFAAGLPGVAPSFAGLAAHDGTLYLSADAEGSVLLLTEEPGR